MENLREEMNTLAGDANLKYIDFLVHFKDLQQNKLDADFGPKFDLELEKDRV